MAVDGYVSSHLATIYANEVVAVPKYLFYMLCLIDAKTLTENQNYPSLRLTDIFNIKIPLPPLSIQQEIVSKIEQYEKIIAGAKQVVENYKPQIDIKPDWEMVELVKIADVNDKSVDEEGKPVTKMFIFDAFDDLSNITQN